MEANVITFKIIVAVIVVVSNIRGEPLGCETKTGDFKVLNCSHSNFTEFPDLSDLSHPPSIIDLSDNYITSITRINISDPSTLTFVNLSRNRITTIEYDSFVDLINLDTLDLSYNHLQGSSLIVKIYKFELKLSNLKWLSFRGNPLGLVKSMTFTSHGYMLLEHLDLSHCRITTLEHLALDNLIKLKNLSLQYNEITALDPSMFTGLMELEILDLSYNEIKVLENVPSLMSLKKMNLDNNKIETISDQAFSSISELEILSLRNNKLKYITHLSINWDDVKTLLLQGNPWHCDCNMKWVKTSSYVIQDHLTDSNFICAYPASLRGMNIKEVDADEFRCPRSLAGFIAILLAALTIVLVFGGVITVIYSNRKSLNCLSGKSGSYIAVYTNDEETNDPTVTISDNRNLLNEKEIYA